MAYSYTWDLRGTETMCELISLSCQLDMTLITMEETLRGLCLAQTSLWVCL